MTNAEKYLKDGIGGVQDLTKALMEFNEERKFVTDWYAKAHSKDFIDLFFNEETKPTLTEDERVILRNIKTHCNKIGRDENSILYLGNCNTVYKDRAISGYYNHLFQFIKERRRI